MLGIVALRADDDEQRLGPGAHGRVERIIEIPRLGLGQFVIDHHRRIESELGSGFCRDSAIEARRLPADQRLGGRNNGDHFHQLGITLDNLPSHFEHLPGLFPIGRR